MAMADDAHDSWCYLDEMANKMLVDPLYGLDAAMADDSLQLQPLPSQNTVVAGGLVELGGGGTQLHGTHCQGAGPAAEQVLLSQATRCMGSGLCTRAAQSAVEAAVLPCSLPTVCFQPFAGWS